MSYNIQSLILSDRLVERVREPLFEVLLAAEYLRHQEMHERPKFHHIVLQWSSSQKKSSLCIKSKKSLPPLTFKVLDILGLIQDHIVPLLPSKGKVILNYKLVRGDADVERIFLAPPMPLNLPLFLRAKVGQNLQCRAPLFEFHLPVDNDCCGYNNKMRSPNALIAGE